jgi:hypothetical protein
MSDFVIQPDTRIADLLEVRPEAEEVLIRIAPQFRALKNPVLRRTVAKVATLAQAAKVTEIPVRDLVLGLRRELGVEGGGEVAAGVDGEPLDAPNWVDLDAEPVIDGGALLEAGETPIARVAEALAGMEPGAVLVLSAPFQPVPLMDGLRGRGHEVFAREAAPDDWTVWVRRR